MVDENVYGGRAARLRRRLGQQGLKGVVVVPGPNMKYLSGIESFLLERPFMMLLPTVGGAHLVAPELESGPYRTSPLGISVHSWTDSEGPEKAIGEATRQAGFEGSWGVEGRAPFAYLENLKKGSRTRLKGAEQILQELREVKDEAEVKLLRKSSAILSRSFQEFPGLFKEGMTETELAKKATEVIYQEGATKVDDMLVQSGARAADPHSLPSSKKIRRGESIIIDVGATYRGYYSDVTRTMCFGASKEVEEVYGEVLRAQEAAVQAAGEGVEVGTVDDAARSIIARAGHAREFFHRTGHGLGLEIHEGPYIVAGGREKLKEGMVFTVEPGIYLKGNLGVRIEDNVLIHGGKGEDITKVPRAYGWWR